MRNIVLLIGFMLASSLVNAVASCDEKITRLILHSDSNVYFSSSESCDTWCKINFTDQDQLNRTYSMLLAATTTNRVVRIQWPGINSCNEQNAAYAAPSYITYLPQ